ncbi:hypothetical protein MKW94_029342 [Papaver nudicaule]|uniref:Ataxin-2 C-terminal domain-containing protein n=1 Tax=Papaver nudicaule TaxID=74823 RepID=A0AA41RWU1_PAPNU|nr:hypothetical protein [Papaver nudicaule]
MAAAVAEQKSSLNPDAPLFIPEAFRHVEDFSPEWWDLVKTSTWFRDFWLNSQEEEEGYFFDENDKSEIADLLPESFDLGIEEEEEEDEFPNLEAELDDMVRSSEAGDYKNQLAVENSKHLKNELEIDEAPALMKNLGLQQSSPRACSKSPVYREKPTQYGSPKCSSSSPRFIHQPR